MAGKGNDREIVAIKSFCVAKNLDCLFPDDMLRQAIAASSARNIYCSYDFHLIVEGNRILGSWLGNQVVQLLPTNNP